METTPATPATPRTNARSPISISAATCVEALANSFLSRRQALQAELAVGLVIFAAEGDEATKEAKRDLRALYATAGYLCVDSKGTDYKNINKRINITAALYTVIGRKTVRQWIGTYTEGDVLAAVILSIEDFQFSTLDDVLEYCNKPNNKTARQRANEAKAAEARANAAKGRGGPQNRRAVDVEGAWHIDTREIHITIPPTASADEMREAAAKLLELAAAAEASQSKAVVADAAPEPQGNADAAPEMHAAAPAEVGAAALLEPA